MLTEREESVLKILKENPYISQRELANILQLNRSTIASVISSLVTKEEVLGRAYILKDNKDKIFCIGGMNVDRKFQTLNTLVQKTSNPARSEISVGGVARNVGENLGRLGFIPNMLSVGGRDSDMDYIIDNSHGYLNFQHVRKLDFENTGSYTAVLNSDGEMEVALAVMEIYEKMDLDWIISYSAILADARLIILDLNVPMETVNYIIGFAKNKNIPLIVIPVSSPKMSRLPKALHGVTWMIANQDESEGFFNFKVNNDNDFENLPEMWIDAGVENVIVTRGNKNSIYMNKNGDKKEFTPPRSEKIVDVTGAGDSYSAGIIYGYLMGFDFEKTVELAMTNAYYTIRTKETVRTDLNREILENQWIELKERKIL